jgi:hypothetical protein
MLATRTEQLQQGVALPQILFAHQGFAVIPDLLSQAEVQLAQQLVAELIVRYRSGEPSALAAGVSIASISKHHPERNPNICASLWEREPYIIGDLIAFDSRFSCLLSTQRIWQCASQLLECSLPEVVFHFTNLTRKPAGIGPALSWHRDADNTYFAAADSRTVRFLFPLQPMSETNGGTAILPGSHQALVSDTPSDFATAVCPLVTPGSGLVLHPGTLHGGSPNRSKTNRDVIVVQFGVHTSKLKYKADETLSLCSWKEFNAICAYN